MPALSRGKLQVKPLHPDVPIVLYANGSGGLLERMGCVPQCGAAFRLWITPEALIGKFR